ncbi:MAG: RNA-binding cell elongation regulator Jag/EloR [Dehalococcoidia bacterium]|nr:RNA-binding cell elongation regulator Jag/EloR [Dehalococcoidia bacterium]
MDKNYLEISARTVEEAVREALQQMGATKEDVEITVIKKGRAGILGLGTEEAVVGVQRVKPAAGHPKAVDSDDAVPVAIELISETLKIMGLQATVSAIPPASSEEPLAFDITGDDLGMLIGRRGQTLASFQFIIRLMVAHRLQSWIPLTIDVEGYKKRRMESLRVLALRMAEQVKRTKRSLTMEPMPADERRIVHIALADDPEVATISDGDGDERKVTLTLKKK